MILTLGYVRVSTIEQEQGFGPEAQNDAILRYCAEHNLGSVEVLRESRSGESILNRAELHLVLARLEAAAEDGVECHLVFYSLDRLTRNLLDQEALVRRSFEKKFRLHSTLLAENDTLDPAFEDDPMRQAIRQIFGVFHQLDRKVIQRRLTSGLIRKALRGGFCGGRVPFGYLTNNQELEVDPEQAPIVCRLFQLIDAGLSQQATAAILAREYPDTCSHWRGTQVSRAVKRRELYEQGIYKPRGGEEALQRPDLVVLRDEFRRRAEVTRDMDLSRLPDPIRLSALAILFDREEAELRSIVVRHGIMVRYRGSSPLVPSASVHRIYEVLQEDIQEGQKPD